MRIHVAAFVGMVLIAGSVSAQTPSRAPAAPKPATPSPAPSAVPAAPAAPAREGQPINVKVELTITEEGGAAPPVRKTVSAVVGDGFNGYVRETASSNTGNVPVPLNLDAFPVLLANGKVRLACTIQYLTALARENDPRSRTDVKQNLVLILESGKSLVVSEATDPISDRKVTVEVRATILK